MSILDDVLKRVLPNSEAASPIAIAVGSVIFSQLTAARTGTAAAPAQPASGAAPTQGNLVDGLGGLINTLEQAGLGDVVKSWIGTGPNQPVDAQKIGMALGQEAITVIAAKTGLDQQVLQQQLAQYLPSVIDHLTPNGRLPTHQEVSAHG